MVTYKPEDLYETGAEVQDFAKGLATNIANEVCELYQASPKGFVTGTIVDGPSQLLRGYWDSFCGRLPEPKLPQPPTRPFDGGQCQSIYYVVSGTLQIFNRESGTSAGNENWVGEIYGPISSIAVEDPNPTNSQLASLIIRGGDGGTGTGLNQVRSVARELFGIRNVSISSIVRADGLPDNCGNLGADYPSTNLPAPTNPREYTYPSPGADPPRIPYSIDFDPTVIVPIVRVGVEGEVNIPVSFDAGGITVELPDLNIGEGEGGGISPEDLQALLDAASKIPELQDALDDLTRNGDIASTDKGEQDGEQEEDVAGIAGVLIQVTSYPTGYGRRFGKPQLFDFGRLHFKRGSFYTGSVPLSTVTQWCPAEPDSTGYAIAFNKDVKANVTVIKKVKNNGG